MRLSNNGLSTYQRCPREYEYRYIVDARPVRDDSSEALETGRSIHTALERFYGSLEGEARIAQSLTDPKTRAMFLVYAALYGEEPWETLSVEAPFAADRGGYVVDGRLDLTVRLAHDLYGFRRGDVVIVEHKTSSEDVSAGSMYWKRLRIATQPSIYLAAVPEAVGVVYNILKRPAHRRRAGESDDAFCERIAHDLAADPDTYFVRGGVVRTDAEAAASAEDIEATVQLIQLGRFPRNPQQCVRYGRECPYFDVCTGAARIDDPSRFRPEEIQL